MRMIETPARTKNIQGPTGVLHGAEQVAEKQQRREHGEADAEPEAATRHRQPHREVPVSGLHHPVSGQEREGLVARNAQEEAGHDIEERVRDGQRAGEGEQMPNTRCRATRNSRSRRAAAP